MNIPILLFISCIVLAIATLQLMGRTRPQQPPTTPAARTSAWLTILTTPALLVPTALAGTVIAIGTLMSPGSFRIVPLHDGHRNSAWLGNVGLVLVMSMLVAGFIGLLGPSRAGRKPGGGHFVAGIRDHTVAIFLAQIAAFLFVRVFATELRVGGSMQTTFSTIFLLAPSLALAPLLGTTALYPRRPFRALKAAFDRIAWDLHATARLLCGQILIVVLIWVVFFGRSGMRHLSSLARESSALSFHPVIPNVGTSFGTSPAPEILLTAATMVTHTVFMMLYHRRVMNVPTRPENKR